MLIAIHGIGGAMGKNVLACAKARNFDIVGIDSFANPANFDVPVYKTLSDMTEKCDVIVDFSVKSALPCILAYAIENRVPAVLCTTGYDKKDFSLIDDAAKQIPVFQSGNMSVGINVLQKLVKSAAKMFGGSADVEIIEQHHNKKADAPSGTALMLANSVKEELPDTAFIYGREGMVGKRPKGEVAIHAVRGGTIVGKHEVIFALDNQVITLKHEAENKAMFAEGSLDAAKWLITQPAGRYNMDDMLR